MADDTHNSKRLRAPLIPATPRSLGGNQAKVEHALGMDLKHKVRTYGRQIGKHREDIAAIHQTILGIGRDLLAGRDMHPSNKRFKEWCVRHCEIDDAFADAFKDREERTAAMTIATLHDHGIDPLGLDDGDHDDSTDKIKLDLSNCHRTAPTNILSWARKHQPDLFPVLAKKRAEALKSKGLARQKMIEGGGEGLAEDGLDDIGAERIAFDLFGLFALDLGTVEAELAATEPSQDAAERLGLLARIFTQASIAMTDKLKAAARKPKRGRKATGAADDGEGEA